MTSLNKHFAQGSQHALIAFAAYWKEVSESDILLYQEGESHKGWPRYLMVFHETYFGVFETDDHHFCLLPVHSDTDYFMATVDVFCDIVCENGRATVTGCDSGNLPRGQKPVWEEVAEEMGGKIVSSAGDRIAENLARIKAAKSS